MDFFGIIVLGISTALGGGILRDILIGNLPPVALREPLHMGLSAAAAILVMFFPKRFARPASLLLFFDAVGLAVFTAVGTRIAMDQVVTSTFIAVTVGVITGVGGGILRDLFAQEIPLVFRKEIYATASIIGALGLVYSRPYFGSGSMAPLYICFGVTLLVRLLTLYFGINSGHPAEANEPAASESM